MGDYRGWREGVRMIIAYFMLCGFMFLVGLAAAVCIVLEIVADIKNPVGFHGL